jgi:polyphosphate kinase 2
MSVPRTSDPDYQEILVNPGTDPAFSSDGRAPAHGNGVAVAASLAGAVSETTARAVPSGLSALAELITGGAEGPYPFPEVVLTRDELTDLHSSRELIQLLRSKNIDVARIKSAIKYEYELECLQVELVKMQHWIQAHGKRLAILFEGRDAAGKGGTIRRFIEHLNPRAMRVVALPKPNEEETGQWYFQRYMKQLPNRGEIVFFDRSWYNRAVVEPVNGFCTQDDYERFMRQVPEFEHMLVEDGVILVKFWFSISKEIQAARFESRSKNPLKQWKLSPLDGLAQDLWDSYTRYKEVMFSRTHTSFSPWIIVKANNKRRARLESIRHVLSIHNYAGNETAKVSVFPDPNIVTRFHRSAIKVD